MELKLKYVLFAFLCIKLSLLFIDIKDPLISAKWKTLHYKKCSSKDIIYSVNTTDPNENFRLTIFVKLHSVENNESGIDTQHCIDHFDTVFGSYSYNAFYDGYEAFYISYDMMDKYDIDKTYTAGAVHDAYVDKNRCVYHKHNPYKLLKIIFKFSSYVLLTIECFLLISTLIKYVIKFTSDRNKFKNRPNDADNQYKRNYQIRYIPFPEII